MSSTNNIRQDDVKQTNDKGEPLKRCKVLDTQGNKCETLYVNDSSTGNAINHLLTDHEISKNGKINNKQQTLPAILQV
ncbi:4064_t:CDS:2 [Funneliformis caledonium]|uniref:4064_t:CDS:1 n=1 Tax=Funneliformis caledonium TaxID=1117310 RepID=A0A9N9DDT4_9GLOM|nr:4064_t:CDS:2 [Funneliformis caledonium]